MGKSKAPDPPNYQPTADASNYAVDAGKEQFAQQQAFTREQWDYYKPIMEEITAAQMAQMRTQTQIGQEQWQQYKNTAVPLQEGLAQKAQDYSTEAKQQELALQFKAGHEQAVLGRTRSRNQQMLSMGVNPNAGRFQGLQRSADVQDAALEAAGMNATRQQADQFGHALTLDAISATTGAAGLSQGAYASAMNAGNSAGANAMAGGNNYMANMGAANNAGLGWHQQGMAGYNNIMGTQASIYNNYEDPGMAMLGMAGQGLATFAGLKSDRRLKRDIVEVGTYPNGLPMYEFTYKRDSENIRWRGVMADDVEKVVPEAVVTDADGFKAVRYDLLGIEMERAA